MNWRGDLTVGDPVTVLARRGMPGEFEVFKAKIIKLESGVVDVHLEGFSGNRGNIAYKLAEEGIFWARGHEGSAIDALLVADALR